MVDVSRRMPRDFTFAASVNAGESVAGRCFARHMLNHQALKAGLAALGITYAAQEGHQLPMLNAVRIPDGVDDAAIRNGLLNRFGIEIGGGLGAFKGKVWRITAPAPPTSCSSSPP